MSHTYGLLIASFPAFSSASLSLWKLTAMLLPLLCPCLIEFRDCRLFRLDELQQSVSDVLHWLRQALSRNRAVSGGHVCGVQLRMIEQRHQCVLANVERFGHRRKHAPQIVRLPPEKPRNG